MSRKRSIIPLSYKPESIRLNMSSSFMVRTLCKNCRKGPDYYYRALKPFTWPNVRGFLIFSQITRGWIQKLVSNWYLKYKPRYFWKLDDFSFKLEDKAYLALYHRARGISGSDKNNVIEFLGCQCGATVWAFNEKSTKDRPEITNRKSRYKYPQSFSY